LTGFFARVIAYAGVAPGCGGSAMPFEDDAPAGVSSEVDRLPKAGHLYFIPSYLTV